MRKILAMAILLWSISGLFAAEQPPYSVPDPAVSENFREIYRLMDQHRHNQDDSQRPFDLVPDTGTTYDLGTSSNPWRNLYISSITFPNGTAITGASGADNFGNHKATRAVDMAGFAVTNSSGLVVKVGSISVNAQQATSALDVNNGSITTRGAGAGYAVNGMSVISSSWTTFAIIRTSTGAIAANATLTITSAQIGIGSIGTVICGEIEDVNTAGTSIRVKDTVAATSFQVYNSDVLNSKKFTCVVIGNP